jgi:hypothetical protein
MQGQMDAQHKHLVVSHTGKDVVAVCVPGYILDYARVSSIDPQWLKYRV